MNAEDINVGIDKEKDIPPPPGPIPTTFQLQKSLGTPASVTRQSITTPPSLKGTIDLADTPATFELLGHRADSLGPYHQVSTPLSGGVLSTRDSLVDAATDAVQRQLSYLQDVAAPRTNGVRDNIRRIHSHARADLPEECFINSEVKIGRKMCTLQLEQDLLSWTRNGVTKGSLDADSIVAATASDTCILTVHYFQQGKGKKHRILRRKAKKYTFQLLSTDVVQEWVNAISILVRWQARAPLDLTIPRKIKVVVNPHSGKRKGMQIYENKVLPWLKLAGIEPHMELTTYAGHAIDMGKNYSTESEFEALVFVGGDGTISEYMNGLLARPTEEWREIAATTPIALISAGTDNAFNTGVGVPSLAAGLFTIIKRKMRPLDVITLSREGSDVIQYSCVGIGWGLPGDIAEESEKYRCLGTWRYAFLKAKRGLFAKKHTGKISYIDAKRPLREYYETRASDGVDQHITEQGSPYAAETPTSAKERKWAGIAGAVLGPGSEARYDDNQWKHIDGSFIGLGVLNASPEGLYTHPSDGNIDLLVAKKGGLFKMLCLASLLPFKAELRSSLMTYVKVKAVIIEQNEPENVVNLDGEVVPGPGPWRLEVVPSLLKVLSEY